MARRTIRTCDGCGAELPRNDGYPGIEAQVTIIPPDSGPTMHEDLDACSGTHLLLAIVKRPLGLEGTDTQTALVRALGLGDPPAGPAEAAPA